MAIDWVVGDSRSIPVKWTRIETVVPIPKELLTARFTVASLESSGRQYWDNLGLYKNLSNDRELANYIIYIPIHVGTTEYPVFGAIVDCHIAAAHIIPKADIIGTDPDPPQLLIRNMATDAIICTKTFITGNNALAYQLTSFGKADETNREFIAGQGAKLEVLGAYNMPEMLLAIEWNLS